MEYTAFLNATPFSNFFIENGVASFVSHEPPAMPGGKMGFS